MPVLLLARGDQESKALLRRAIEARYGLGPPVLETLKLQLKGRARAKVGPVTTWVPLTEVVASGSGAIVGGLWGVWLLKRINETWLKVGILILGLALFVGLLLRAH